MYSAVVGFERFSAFFTKFKFWHMKKQKKGVNDVDAIVFNESEVLCTEQSDILSTIVNFQNMNMR